MNGHVDDATLNALLDDELAPAEREGAEAHVAACAACAAELAALRALALDLAGLPRAVAPGRDLLAGIHARLDGGAVVPLRPDLPVSTGTPSRRSPFGQRTVASARWTLAAAAAVLVILSSAVTALLIERRDDGPAFIATDASALVPPVELDRVEARFVSATSELERVLNAQRSSLSPETVRILEENLAIIDAALVEARAALRADPGNPVLSEILMATYEMKLDLLRRAATSVIT
jgi:hypothetical protein